MELLIALLFLLTGCASAATLDVAVEGEVVGGYKVKFARTLSDRALSLTLVVVFAFFAVILFILLRLYIIRIRMEREIRKKKAEMDEVDSQLETLRRECAAKKGELSGEDEKALKKELDGMDEDKSRDAVEREQSMLKHWRIIEKTLKKRK